MIEVVGRLGGGEEREEEEPCSPFGTTGGHGKGCQESWRRVGGGEEEELVLFERDKDLRATAPLHLQLSGLGSGPHFFALFFILLALDYSSRCDFFLLLHTPFETSMIQTTVRQQ